MKSKGRIIKRHPTRPIVKYKNVQHRKISNEFLIVLLNGEKITYVYQLISKRILNGVIDKISKVNGDKFVNHTRIEYGSSGARFIERTTVSGVDPSVVVSNREAIHAANNPVCHYSGCGLGMTLPHHSHLKSPPDRPCTLPHCLTKDLFNLKKNSSFERAPEQSKSIHE